jgi:hypothetical protein
VRPTPRTIDGLEREAAESLEGAFECRHHGVVHVYDDVEHLLGADGGERHDGVTVLDRQAGEPDALLPDQLVVLASALVDLARAAGEREHVLTLAHERADVVARAADHPAYGEQVAPQRDRVVGVLAQPADGHPAASPELGHHEWEVHEAVDGVVADEQDAVVGDAVDAVELGVG